jgi:hypothetical protein
MRVTTMVCVVCVACGTRALRECALGSVYDVLVVALAACHAGWRRLSWAQLWWRGCAWAQRPRQGAQEGWP